MAGRKPARKKADGRGKGRPVKHTRPVGMKVSEEIYERLKETAAADDRPIGAYVRRLVIAHFQQLDEQAE